MLQVVRLAVRDNTSERWVGLFVWRGERSPND